MELLSFHTMQFHIWVNYYGSIQINSHPFTSLFPINMIFECLRLVPFSGLCTQQLYNSVNYFLKKTHISQSSDHLFFPFLGNTEESKYQNINKHSEFDLGSHAVAISAPTTQMMFHYTSHQRGMHHHTN